MESREQPSDTFSFKRTRRIATVDEQQFQAQPLPLMQKAKSKSYSERFQELA